MPDEPSTSLVDRVAEAMAGWPMDTAPAEDAEAWRANAKAAIRVMRDSPQHELRDDLVLLLVEAQASYMTADAELLTSNAMVIADAILDRYDLEPLSADPEAEAS